MRRTLGQVAFEGFHSTRQRAKYKHRHTWEVQPQWNRNDWQAAAEAVAQHIQKGWIVTSPEEQAVIEAAKAWLRSADPRNPENHIHARSALGTAVKALDSEEER